MMFALGQGPGREETVFSGYRASTREDEIVLQLVMLVVHPCECVSMCICMHT